LHDNKADTAKRLISVRRESLQVSILPYSLILFVIRQYSIQIPTTHDSSLWLILTMPCMILPRSCCKLRGIGRTIIDL